jgi:hypothetical protein
LSRSARRTAASPVMPSAASPRMRRTRNGSPAMLGSCSGILSDVSGASALDASSSCARRVQRPISAPHSRAPDTRQYARHSPRLRSPSALTACVARPTLSRRYTRHYPERRILSSLMSVYCRVCELASFLTFRHIVWCRVVEREADCWPAVGVRYGFVAPPAATLDLCERGLCVLSRPEGCHASAHKVACGARPAMLANPANDAQESHIIRARQSKPLGMGAHLADGSRCGGGRAVAGRGRHLDRRI